MMNGLMSAVVRQVTGRKIQAELFQPAELSVKTVLMLPLVLSGRNFGEQRSSSFNTPMCFFEVISGFWFKNLC